jgi:hypothetical protein
MVQRSAMEQLWAASVSIMSEAGMVAPVVVG